MGQRVLTVKWLDYEKEFNKSFNEKKDGFILQEDIDYYSYLTQGTKDKVLELTAIDSIYSYKFGITLQDEGDTLHQMYSCKCGRTVGRERLHNVCNVCDTVVERADVKEVGWFILERDKMLHPYLAFIMSQTTTGDKNIFQRLDKNELSYTWEDILLGDEETLDDFVTKYLKSNKEVIGLYKDRLKTSKYQIISKNYRPFVIEENLGSIGIKANELNTLYMEISNTINALNSNHNMIKQQKIQKLKTLAKTTAKVIETIFKEIADTKTSFIRSEIYARRFPNSGRNVIEPIIDEDIHSIDVVQLSVDFFRVVFSKDVKQLLKEREVHPNKIKELIDIDYVLTSEEKRMIKEEIFPLVKEPYVYINREPSIYMTSILGMRVHSLIDEMVLRIPFFILGAIAGDFDGDVLAIIAWDVPEERKRIHEALGPQVSVINTATISYNTGIGPNNNTAVLLHKGFNKDSILKKDKDVIKDEKKDKG